MNNWDKYRDEIIAILDSTQDGCIAIDCETGVPMDCGFGGKDCSQCRFSRSPLRCKSLFGSWLFLRADVPFLLNYEVEFLMRHFRHTNLLGVYRIEGSLNFNMVLEGSSYDLTKPSALIIIHEYNFLPFVKPGKLWTKADFESLPIIDV